MARVFMAGFEDGSTNGVTSDTTGAAASTTQKRTGAYSLYTGWHENGRARIALPAGVSEIYGRVGFFFTRTESTPAVLALSDVAGTALLTLTWNSALGQLSWRLTHWGGTVLVSSSTNLVSLNAWYCVEFHVIINDAGTIEWKVDGATQTAFSGDTKAGANADIYSIDLDAHGGWSGNVYFDDVAINDTTGAVNNSWIGTGGIVWCPPAGAGNHTGMTPSTGANYECVNEVPASDTDYVSSGTVDAYDLYTIDDAALPAAYSVSAVKLVYRAKVDTGVANITPTVRSGGTTEQQADIPVGVSYAVKSQIHDVDPIDNAAWTSAKIAALEIGQAVG